MKQLALDTQEVITPNSEFDECLIYVANIECNKCILMAPDYVNEDYKWVIIENSGTLLSAGNACYGDLSFYEAIKWAIDEMNGNVYTLSSIDEFADWLKD